MFERRCPIQWLRNILEVCVESVWIILGAFATDTLFSAPGTSLSPAKETVVLTQHGCIGHRDIREKMDWHPKMSVFPRNRVSSNHSFLGPLPHIYIYIRVIIPVRRWVNHHTCQAKCKTDLFKVPRNFSYHFSPTRSSNLEQTRPWCHTIFSAATVISVQLQSSEADFTWENTTISPGLAGVANKCKVKMKTRRIPHEKTQPFLRGWREWHLNLQSRWRPGAFYMAFCMRKHNDFSGVGGSAHVRFT